MTNHVSRRYRFGPFQLDVGEQVLRREGQTVPLKPKVFELLVVLVENAGCVVRKEELMKRLWPESFVEDSNLAVSICELRKTLGGGRTGHWSYIETVPRRGYRFVPRVSDESGEAAGATASDSSLVGASNGDRRVRGTIAVLPFKSIGETGDTYLGLGMADALITRLSNLRQITVRPTSSVRKYDGSQDPAAAGRELGVEWVLDGSVQRSGKRIRATVQLVKVGEGASKWAGKFDEEFNDIFGVEDSISEQVVDELRLKLTEEERALLGKRYTDNTVAYLAYLKGRYCFGKRTKEGLEQGIEYFMRAIAVDPNYALAYSGLADCYSLLRQYGPLSPNECLRRGMEAALKALELDDDIAEAHASLGHLSVLAWDWARAESELKRAIALNPNYATAHNWYAVYLRTMGRFDEAMRVGRRAMNLDPLSLIMNAAWGTHLYFARHYDKAIEQLQRTLELEPKFAVAHLRLGLVYEAKGMYPEAQAMYEQTTALIGEFTEITACLGRIAALTGKTENAKKAIEELNRASVKSGAGCCYYVAGIYAALGNRSQAFSWLERGYAEHEQEMAMLNVDTSVDRLRDDPRFVSLLERLGFGYRANRETVEAASGGWPR